jgi:predicted nucleic acid-binding protein
MRRPARRLESGRSPRSRCTRSRRVANVAICSYVVTMASTGIRELKDNPSLPEAARAIVRARVGARLTAEAERAAVCALRRFERRCYVVAVTDEVLARVRRPFPVEPVRTLDAVQLATAESLGEPPQLMTIVSRDNRVRENATALGYSVE